MLFKTLFRRFVKGIANYLTPTGEQEVEWERKNFWLRLSGLDISARGVAISRGFECLDGLEENICIGRYVAIGQNLKLWNFSPIDIGPFCMIAAGVTVSNGWHDKSTFVPSSGPVVIGPGCWIGVNATIVGNINIGPNSIIAAGALVNRDVESQSIVAGVPARVIGKRVLSGPVWHFGNLYFCPDTFELV